jgi:hypothetical protein
MHLAAAHFMYIVRTAMTHLPINPLIEQPKERRREWILTSSLHDQILFTY